MNPQLRRREWDSNPYRIIVELSLKDLTVRIPNYTNNNINKVNDGLTSLTQKLLYGLRKD